MRTAVQVLTYVAVFDLDIYTHDDFWSTLLLRREGLPGSGRAVTVFAEKGQIACRERYRKLCWTYARAEDQLQESRVEILARLPALAEP